MTIPTPPSAAQPPLPPPPSPERPTLALITTGGTIAGTAASATDTTAYTAASLPATALLAAVPDIAAHAALRIESPFDIDSKDITSAHWLALAQRAQALLDDPAIDGLVITHGTDTLEESAQLLDRCLDTRKPVVLTGAMRPATALSADGPMNLYDAIRAAAHYDSAGRGVMVCFNRSLFAARDLRKLHTSALEAFGGGSRGRIGQTDPLMYFAPPDPPAASLPLPPPGATLPRTEVLYVAADSTPDLLELAVAAGCRGVVLALPGNGSLPATWEPAVARVVAQGIPVVRASRCAAGRVSPHPVDGRLGCTPAGELSAAAARILLSLQLLSVDAG